MFTIEQIKAAHSKVKSGADFPSYLAEIKKLGVIFYEVFVADGQANYYGANEFKATSPPRHAPVTIADHCRKEQFVAELKAHQQGKTDYSTFISKSAEFGVDKWEVCTKKMTCTYYDKMGNEILKEEIPQ